MIEFFCYCNLCRIYTSRFDNQIPKEMLI